MEAKFVTSRIFKGAPKIAGMSDEENSLIETYIASAKELSSMVTESVYIVDLAERRFRFVADHALFLCGHTCNEALQLGYDFYSKIVHPDDLPMLIDAYRVILQHLYASDTVLSGDYYSFTFRIRSFPQLHHHPEYLMVYHKIKPVIIQGKVQIAFCTLSSSVIKTSGHLRIYYKTQQAHAEYDFQSRKWRQQKVEKLTNQEKLILKLAKQGKDAREMSEILCLSLNTVQNERKHIYVKLSVHSMEEAVIYATNHRLIFT
jgi:DNA-binding CsgD family transcriptional regulator